MALTSASYSTALVETEEYSATKKITKQGYLTNQCANDYYNAARQSYA